MSESIRDKYKFLFNITLSTCPWMSASASFKSLALPGAAICDLSKYMILLKKNIFHLNFPSCHCRLLKKSKRVDFMNFTTVCNLTFCKIVKNQMPVENRRLNGILNPANPVWEARYLVYFNRGRVQSVLSKNTQCTQLIKEMNKYAQIL